MSSAEVVAAGSHDTYSRTGSLDAPASGEPAGAAARAGVAGEAGEEALRGAGPVRPVAALSWAPERAVELHGRSSLSRADQTPGAPGTPEPVYVRVDPAVDVRYADPRQGHSVLEGQRYARWRGQWYAEWQGRPPYTTVAIK